MTLSILICSIKSRAKQLRELLLSLNEQTNFNEVEILTLTDNCEMKVGEKRNRLLLKAKGKYICFIDDDDIVTPSYIAKILEAAKEDMDVIVFDAFRYDKGVKDRLAKYGIEYKRDSNTKDVYYRIPNHLMPVKRELALQAPFKEINFGEDADYAKRLLPLLKTQIRIDDTLYFYMYNPKK